VAHQAENIIEAVDSDEDEGYDGYVSETATRASSSLSSTARDYAFENGRRYHKFREGQYQFPNDEPEQAREDSMEPIPFILLIHPDFSSGSNCNRLTNYHSETCNDRQLVWWEAALCSYGKSSPSIGPRNGDWDMVHRQ
jgi:hypothetical protein